MKKEQKLQLYRPKEGLTSCHGDHKNKLVPWFSLTTCQPLSSTQKVPDMNSHAKPAGAHSYRHTLAEFTSHRDSRGKDGASFSAEAQLKPETAATTESTVSTLCCASTVPIIPTRHCQSVMWQNTRKTKLNLVKAIANLLITCWTFLSRYRLMW